MKLEIIYSNTEPLSKEVLWITKEGFAHIVTSQGHEAYYTINANGSVLVDEDYVSTTSLYGKYKTVGGTKLEEEFYNELINLIG
jgi:hypothetical protein